MAESLAWICHSRTKVECGGCQLEKTHGTARKSLFRSEAGRKFSKFIQLWTYSTLANELRPMLYPAVRLHRPWHPQERRDADVSRDQTHDRMDAPSQAEFTAQLRGTSTDEKDAEWAKAATRAILKNEDREKQYEAARHRLNLIESYLTSSSNPYLMGEKASHADFALFAAYAWSRANTEMAEAVWRHPSLPSVVEWLDRMFGSDFVDTKRLV